VSEQEQSTPVQEPAQSKWLQEWNDECDKILAEYYATVQPLGLSDTIEEKA
jgi:hypothetical protein